MTLPVGGALGWRISMRWVLCYLVRHQVCSLPSQSPYGDSSPKGRALRVKKASQSLPPQRQIKPESCLTEACTSANIHIGWRVWNLAVIDGQIMHGSSRSLLAEKPEGIFRQSKKAADESLLLFA